VSGKIITCMDLESTGGKTDEDMRVSILMTKSTDTESTTGQTAGVMRETGVKASSTGRESMYLQMER
jgi:hypothetical protein